VVPLERWLDDATLLAIAAENKMAATAFVLGGNADYQIRWMTPDGRGGALRDTRRSPPASS
jgi:predicted PhzF superfamily epimerase YddE/YHI9